MPDSDTAPIYPRETDNLLFFCDNVPTTKDCAAEVSGTETWKNVATLTGNYNSVELRGGQATALKFEKEITPAENSFCVKVIYRKSSLKAGERDDSDAGVEIITANKVTLKKLKTSPLHFRSYQVTLSWKKPSKIALHFSVPSGRKTHIFDVKEIIAYNGKCSKAPSKLD
ncbi:hypothetical protein AVEN_252007-1 [Araneus ventricosus]|uniref:Uncharacterized protein n=1 Tax=Araneus ventricosus TaxID=182803 RepID=A0A4Y2QJK7_ARAVE|nr:hypothetical protein AVEN_252007-1 [Araneus ventricosus]